MVETRAIDCCRTVGARICRARTGPAAALRRAVAGWGLVIALVLGAAGCGQTAGTTLSSEQSTTSLPAASSDTSTPPTAANDIDPVFAELARRLAPMPVYGWATLPDRVTVASKWWPVVDEKTPDQYEGPSHDNPWVSSAPPGEPQAQLVLACEAGWLAVLENFRGDLGDVAGEQVGPVNGHDAALYAVNDGLLVQWSDGGRWYGLFGRGVPADELVAMALDMIPIER